MGTQCDGLAMARAAEGYGTWRVVSGPERMPTGPTGEGLPTSLVNDVLVGRDGTVYAATTTGLAWSKDQGRTWRYVRGRDYAEKVRGLYGGPPAGWRESAGAVLAEDYVTCLAEDGAGLWVGYRQQGCELIDFEAGKSLRRMAEGQFVGGMALTAGGLAVGTYGDGQHWPRGATPAAAVQGPSPLPSGAGPPTAEQLRALTARVRSLGEAGVNAAYLGEDWMTQGDWMGRHGRDCATLCAMNTPQPDYTISKALFNYDVRGHIGPNRTTGDQLRCWVHWIRTEDPRSLYNPRIAIRRQAEWDDHGEAYPMTHDGPDIWATMELPEGTYRISLYFMNKDGHEGRNRARDYLVEIYGDSPWPPGVEPGPALARGRVRQFWGGAYKCFLVRGPGSCRIRIARNYSLNAICSAILIDRLRPPPKLEATNIGWIGDIRYDPPAVDRPADAPVHPSEELWAELEAGCERMHVAAAQPCRVLAYRALQASDSDHSALARWRWDLHLWDAGQRVEFARTMRLGWARMQDFNAHLRSKAFRPYSPGTVEDRE